MLPAPKTHTPQTLGGGKETTAVSAKPPTTKATMLVPDSVARRRAAAAAAAAVKPKSKQAADSDDSDDDDGPATSFFTLEDKNSFDTASLASSSSVTVTANPYAQNPADRPLAFRHRDPGQMLQEEQPEAGPSSSSSDPMVGPSLPTHHPGINAYPEPEDLLANEDALNRLAGSAALRNKEEFDVVDVKVIYLNRNHG